MYGNLKFSISFSDISRKIKIYYKSHKKEFSKVNKKKGYLGLVLGIYDIWRLYYIVGKPENKRFNAKLNFFSDDS